MKRYWTWSREQEWHTRTYEQTTLFFQATIRGRGGHPTTDGTNPLVYVYDTVTGETMIQARYDLRYGIGGVIVPPPPVINWQSVPSYNLGSGDVYINGGAYLKEVYGSAAFNAGYDSPGRLIIENAYIRSAGPALGGFRGMATLRNVVIEVLPPTGENQRTPRAIDLQELRDLELENVTILSGRGIYCSGKDGQFYGNASAGQGVKLRKVRFRNIDGRRSDGAGGYIKSNWGETHSDTSKAPGARRAAIGGVIGWDVGNALQCHEMPRSNILMQWVEVLNELGHSRCEDLVNMHGGSGGAVDRPALIEDCLLDVVGGYDWRYVPGQSASYDASNKITEGATSGQDTSYTASSATGLLLADAYRSNANDNAQYTTARRVVTMGSRPYISMQGGHHLTVDQCEVYDSPIHWSGVPLVARDTAYQFSKYANPGGIWGSQSMTDSVLYKGNTSGPLGPVGDILFNGGTSEGNTVAPVVTDLNPVIAAFRARAQAAGVILGSSLPLPA